MRDEIDAQSSFREIDRHGNPVAPEPATEAVPAGRFAVNLFIVALWVLDAATLLTGIWAFNEGMNPTPGYGPGPMPVAMIVLNFLPYLFIAFALTTAGLLFWHAFQWQKRHGTR